MGSRLCGSDGKTHRPDLSVTILNNSEVLYSDVYSPLRNNCQVWRISWWTRDAWSPRRHAAGLELDGRCWDDDPWRHVYTFRLSCTYFKNLKKKTTFSMTCREEDQTEGKAEFQKPKYYFPRRGAQTWTSKKRELSSSGSGSPPVRKLVRDFVLLYRPVTKNDHWARCDFTARYWPDDIITWYYCK